MKDLDRHSEDVAIIKKLNFIIEELKGRNIDLQCRVGIYRDIIDMTEFKLRRSLKAPVMKTNA